MRLLCTASMVQGIFSVAMVESAPAICKTIFCIPAKHPAQTLAHACLQVVWTAGDKSLLLWCAFSGLFLGSIHHGGDSEDYDQSQPEGRRGRGAKDNTEHEEKRHIDPKKVQKRVQLGQTLAVADADMHGSNMPRDNSPCGTVISHWWWADQQGPGPSPVGPLLPTDK